MKKELKRLVRGEILLEYRTVRMSSLLLPQVKNGLVCNQVILHTISFLTQYTRSLSGIIRIKKKQKSRYSVICYGVRNFVSGNLYCFHVISLSFCLSFVCPSVADILKSIRRQSSICIVHLIYKGARGAKDLFSPLLSL